MRNREIFLESKKVERQLATFQLEGALLEAMKDKFIARAMLAEQRKIEKYALQIGLVNEHQLNEGFLADITLGAGQMLGNWASIVGVPLGSAFGIAGVLWYGNEMLAASPGSFDFFMNLIFCLFSAAAVPDPSPASGTAATLAKTIIAPFAKLGNAAKALGSGVLDAGKALTWVKATGPAAAVATEAAMKAEPGLIAATPWIEKTIASAGEVMTSIASKVKNLPGGSKFAGIVETVTKWAGQAWKFIKECIEALINVGKSAAGKAVNKAVSTVSEMLVKKMSPQVAEKIIGQLATKQLAYTSSKGAARQIIINGFERTTGKIVYKVVGDQTGRLAGMVAEKELPQLISQVAKSFGKDAAAAIIVKAQVSYPRTAIKLALEALEPYAGPAPQAVAAV